MKTTERLDQLSKKFSASEPFIPHKILSEIFGENFFEESYKANNYHVFFEEEQALYHVTIIRKTILNEYAIMRRGKKFYEKVSDPFIEHLLKEEEVFESELRKIKKVTDHSSVRLKKIFKKNHHHDE